MAPLSNNPQPTGDWLHLQNRLVLARHRRRHALDFAQPVADVRVVEMRVRNKNGSAVLGSGQIPESRHIVLIIKRVGVPAYTQSLCQQHCGQ